MRRGFRRESLKEFIICRTIQIRKEPVFETADNCLFDPKYDLWIDTKNQTIRPNECGFPGLAIIGSSE